MCKDPVGILVILLLSFFCPSYCNHFRVTIDGYKVLIALQIHSSTSLHYYYCIIKEVVVSLVMLSIPTLHCLTLQQDNYGIIFQVALHSTTVKHILLQRDNYAIIFQVALNITTV